MHHRDRVLTLQALTINPKYKGPNAGLTKTKLKCYLVEKVNELECRFAHLECHRRPKSKVDFQVQLDLDLNPYQERSS